MARQCSRGPNSCKSRVGAVTPTSTNTTTDGTETRRHEYASSTRAKSTPGAHIVGEDEISPEFVEAIPPEIQIGGDSPGEEEMGKPRGQIDRSARGGSGSVGGYGGGARSRPEHGGGHGGDAIATGVAREKLGLGKTIMAYTFPKRTLRQVEGWLGDYEDPALNHLQMANKHPEVAAQHMDSSSYDSRYGGDNSWNLNCSDSPIESSTGWRFGEPYGDEEEPIPCDTGDESGGVNQYVNRHYGKEEKGTDSISLDLEMGFSKPSQYEEGESSGVKKKKKMRGQGEMALVETEDARREREAKEKEEADAAARAEDAPPPPHPMMHPDFQQYMRAMEEDRRRYQESQNKNMQDFFTHVINDRGNEGRGVTLSDFQNARPLPFASAPEPMDAEDWLMDTERKLRTVGCNDEEKIRYATYLLSGPAASWWENLVAVHPPEKVFTWEEFKKKFRDAHVPESVVELKKREFDELHQNTAPIMQYVRDFNRLSRYAPEEVDTEEKRKKRFMKGMNPYMKMQLRLARTAEFQELIRQSLSRMTTGRSRRIGGRRLVSSQGSTQSVNRLQIGVSNHDSDLL
ncbi:hypothetical protein QYE76_056919 [Lolium multiflorum]|uniref:Retrotransposon gag domain-containing protein n=1 Tax=Lolium multiflorum TaxID=4521 RepID=A0AAD8T431_LOLMU|nr:hypothetical protein QYE76_056919 [Lolium multiflorum]